MSFGELNSWFYAAPNGGVRTRPGLHSKRALRARAFIQLLNASQLTSSASGAGSSTKANTLRNCRPHNMLRSTSVSAAASHVWFQNIESRMAILAAHWAPSFAGLGADQSRCCLMTARQPGARMRSLAPLIPDLASTPRPRCRRWHRFRRCRTCRRTRRSRRGPRCRSESERRPVLAPGVLAPARSPS